MAPPTLLVLDEENLVSTAVERTLARRFTVRRARRSEALDDPTVSAVVVSSASARAIDVSGLPAALPRVFVVVQLPTASDVVTALRAGAHDLVPAGDAEGLLAALAGADERCRLDVELAQLPDAPAGPEIVPQILGESPRMVDVRARVARIAQSSVPVLVSGPSGSGKSLVARALHDAGPRRAGPFVAVPAQVAPPRSLVTELAVAFAAAAGGTLFLEEVALLPLDLQARLVHALTRRSGAAEAAGSTADVRIVAATSRDLHEEARAGGFREDLAWRLAATSLELPPLRERGHDVLLIAQYLIRRASSDARPLLGLTPGAARALVAHDWPGNVRELEQAITVAAATTPMDYVGSADLPAPLGERKVAPAPESLKSLEVVERAHILSTLHAVDGNRALASRILKLDRKTLYRKLKAYAGTEPPPRPRMDSAPG